MEFWGRAGNSKGKGPEELAWCDQGTAGVPVWLAHRVLGPHTGRVAGLLVRSGLISHDEELELYPE